MIIRRRKGAVVLLGITEYLGLEPSAVYCLRILLALFCGIALGTERGLRFKSAGVRIHAILACSAAALMVISKYAFLDLGLPAWSQGFDPTLVAGFIIDGSGFVCAGTIFNKSDRDTISGLTSAANLWATAGIGMACGCGLEIPALFFTLILLSEHWLLSKFGRLATSTRTLRMTIDNTPQVRELLRQTQKEFDIQLVSANYSRSLEDNSVRVQLQIRPRKPIRFEDTIQFLDSHPEVRDVTI